MSQDHIIAESPRQMRFDWTINLGHVLMILTLTGSVFIAYANVIRTQDRQDLRITALEQSAAKREVFEGTVVDQLRSISVDIGVLKDRANIK